MNYEVTAYVRESDFGNVPERVKFYARMSLAKMARTVQKRVKDKTPKLLGGLVRSIDISEGMGGDERKVYAEGVVARVHEFNAVWSKPPPWGRLAIWAVLKFGVALKEAERIGRRVSWKIFKRGLTLPNKEGKGKMFARTLWGMRCTNSHADEYVRDFQSHLRNIFYKGRATPL